MRRTFKKGERVRHPKFGDGYAGTYMDRHTLGVMFDDGGHRVVSDVNLTAIDESHRWSEVMPGDTVEFEVQGDTLKIKAQGSGTQATVLGWRTTELDAVWDLLSIKKRNPPVPTHFGARVMYRDKQWVLLHAAMLPHFQGTKRRMVWIEINEHTFNWVGHQDIDREKFDVIFSGWKNA